MPLVRSPSDNVEDKAKAPAAPARLDGEAVEERWAAARAAGDDPASVPALVSALARETDGGVREAIFTAFARIATPQSVAAVLPYLRSDDAKARTAALDALRAMPQATAPQLAGLLADPDSDVRLLSCEIARAMRGPDATALLLARIENEPQSNVCAAAIEVLAEIGDASVAPALARCAARFPDDPFLAFAAKAAAARLDGRRHG